MVLRLLHYDVHRLLLLLTLTTMTSRSRGVEDCSGGGRTTGVDFLLPELLGLLLSEEEEVAGRGGLLEEHTLLLEDREGDAVVDAAAGILVLKLLELM